MIDSTIIRAHKHSAGALNGQENESLGRSRGGFTTKVHLLLNKAKQVIRLIITGGESSDIGEAEKLVEGSQATSLLADKGYDSDGFREYLKNIDIKPVIPGRCNRLTPIEYNKDEYKERNIIERFFGRIKEFRRIATRYDKTASMYKGSITIAALFIMTSGF